MQPSIRPATGQHGSEIYFLVTCPSATVAVRSPNECPPRRTKGANTCLSTLLCCTTPRITTGPRRNYANRWLNTGIFSEFAGDAITGGAALFPTTTATTVTVGEKGGDIVTADGPFAETKEVLGGFFLLEAPDLDAAIKLAARIPAAWTGKVEVRPVVKM